MDRNNTTGRVVKPERTINCYGAEGTVTLLGGGQPTYLLRVTYFVRLLLEVLKVLEV